MNEKIKTFLKEHGKEIVVITALVIVANKIYDRGYLIGYHEGVIAGSVEMIAKVLKQA